MAQPAETGSAKEEAISSADTGSSREGVDSESSALQSVRQIAIPRATRAAKPRRRESLYGATDIGLPCIVCGRTVNQGRAYAALHVIRGGGIALHPSEEAHYAAAQAASDNPLFDAGDMGFYPIGPDCLRSHPILREFTVRVRARTEVAPDAAMASPAAQAASAPTDGQEHGKATT